MAAVPGQFFHSLRDKDFGSQTCSSRSWRYQGALGIHGAPCFLYYDGDKLAASKCLGSSLAAFWEVNKTSVNKQPCHFRTLT